jgi:hypothetical protein
MFGHSLMKRHLFLAIKRQASQRSAPERAVQTPVPRLSSHNGAKLWGSSVAKFPCKNHMSCAYDALQTERGWVTLLTVGSRTSAGPSGGPGNLQLSSMLRLTFEKARTKNADAVREIHGR